MQTLSDAKRKDAKVTIINCLAQHCSITEACDNAGVVRQTFYTWLDEDEGFRRHVAHAEEEALSELESYLWVCATQSRLDPRYQRSLFYALSRRDRLKERQEDREERREQRAERAEERRHEREMARRRRGAPGTLQSGRPPTSSTRPASPARTTVPVRTAPPVPPRLRRAPALYAVPVPIPSLAGDGHAANLLPDLHPRS